MKIRTTKPYNNKFYITTDKGGYSQCIKGYPNDKNANVLSNCVGYTCGRFNEIIGEMKYPTLYCNAEKFIERAKELGLEISNKPTLGGIMVWAKGSATNSNDGVGHVAIVERIDNSNQIYTSESFYGGLAFTNLIRTNSNGKWGAGANYTFRGCVVNPVIGKTEINTNKNNEVKKGDYEMRVWKNGKTKETVYQDSRCTKIIGYLEPHEQAYCVGELDNKYMIWYAINNTWNGSTNNNKIGFVKYKG